MNNIQECAYIFKKGNNKYSYPIFHVIDLVSGRYDINKNIFIGDNGKNYRYLLESPNEGFALRRHIDKDHYSEYYEKNYKNNFNIKYYNNFCFKEFDGTMKLLWFVNKNVRECIDFDLDNYIDNSKKRVRKKS